MNGRPVNFVIRPPFARCYTTSRIWYKLTFQYAENDCPLFHHQVNQVYYQVLIILRSCLLYVLARILLGTNCCCCCCCETQAKTETNRWPSVHFAASSTSEAKSTRLHSFWQQTSRFGSTICSMTALQTMLTYSSCSLSHLRSVRRTSAGGVYKRLCTSQVMYTRISSQVTSPVYISHHILEGPITLGRLDRFSSTIASMIALAHADVVLQLISGPPEVCAANERRWCK